MRLLFAAGAVPSDRSAMPAGIITLLESATEIYVLSAIYVGRLEWLTGGIDDARRESATRLNTILERFSASPVPVSGQTSDPLKMTAFADAVSEFHPDHILIGYPATDRIKWHGKNLVETMIERFELPVTLFTVPTAAPATSP